MKKLSKKKPLIISLIGMSGSGKSHWSKKLMKRGFRRICCDDLIEEDLSLELKKYSAKGIHDIACWMGQPYEKRFESNQAMYFNSEIKNMRNIVNELKKGIEKDVIIDTTGSVIYIGDMIMKELKKYSLVIYLETPMSSLPEMLKIFMEKPKPVIWRNIFYKNRSETNKEALTRCYPKLLHQRIVLYKKYADVILSYKVRRSPRFSTDSFIQFVERAMRRKKSV